MLMLLAEIDWNSLLRNDDFIMPVLLTVLIVTIGAIIGAAIVVPQWRRARQDRDEAGLKAQMIQRGFSAAEIERVLRTGVGQDRVGRAADRADCRDAVACC